MPNVTIYIDARTYARIAKYMNFWEMGESATIRRILIKGLDQLDKEVYEWKRSVNTGKSTTTT